MGKLKQIINDFSEQALQVIRETGGRVTKTRSLVVECLASATKPLSAQDIFDNIKASDVDVKIDRVSVYRILEALSQKGLVHLVGATGKYIACFHSQCDAGQHLIISCDLCQDAKEIDLPTSLAQELSSYLMRDYGFTSGAHGLVLRGRCQLCSKK